MTTVPTSLTITEVYALFAYVEAHFLPCIVPVSQRGVGKGCVKYYILKAAFALGFLKHDLRSDGFPAPDDVAHCVKLLTGATHDDAEEIAFEVVYTNDFHGVVAALHMSRQFFLDHAVEELNPPVPPPLRPCSCRHLDDRERAKVEVADLAALPVPIRPCSRRHLKKRARRFARSRT